MTVETQVNKVTGNGNGSATVFSFSPIVLPAASTDLEVTHVDSSGTETTLTEGSGSTNYSVSVTSYPGTGSITYPADAVTPMPSGEKVVMKRLLVLEQTVDLENQGGYFPDTQELALDRLVMIDLQQQELLDRTLKFPIGDASLTVELPAAADRASALLGFDASGNVIATSAGVDTALTTTFTETLLDDATSDAFQTTLGFSADVRALLDDANFAAMRVSMGLEIGVDVQAYDAELAALSGLTSAANKVPYFTGSETAGLLDFLDEDTMSSDSATAVASQQSIKAYIDSSSIVSQNTYTSSDTWNKPPAGTIAYIQVWGAGGGGGKDSTGSGGGGGGCYNEKWILLSALGSTETVTIGAGGSGGTSNGQAGGIGGNTTFGAHLTGYGAGGGVHATERGGGAGGLWSAGSTTAAGGGPGAPIIATYNNTAAAMYAASGGVAGGAGGDCHFGGAGGGGSLTGAGGSSEFGGDGGAGSQTGVATNGSQPGGGGGGTRTGTGGDGGDGQCIVTVF